MHGIQSSGLAITPIIYGAIKTVAGWKGIQYFNLASLTICAVASVGLYLGSKVQHNNYLNMSNGTRIKFEKSDEYTAMMQRAYGNLHQVWSLNQISMFIFLFYFLPLGQINGPRHRILNYLLSKK